MGIGGVDRGDSRWGYGEEQVRVSFIAVCFFAQDDFVVTLPAIDDRWPNDSQPEGSPASEAAPSEKLLTIEFEGFGADQVCCFMDSKHPLSSCSAVGEGGTSPPKSHR